MTPSDLVHKVGARCLGKFNSDDRVFCKHESVDLSVLHDESVGYQVIADSKSL